MPPSPTTPNATDSSGNRVYIANPELNPQFTYDKGISLSTINSTSTPTPVTAPTPTPVPNIFNTDVQNAFKNAGYTFNSATGKYEPGTATTNTTANSADPYALGTQGSALSQMIKDLTAQNNLEVGKSAYQQQQNEAFGVNALTRTQQDLQTKLIDLANRAQAIPLQEQQMAQGRGMTAAGLAPIQTADLRNNAIQALQFNSLLASTNNDLTKAESLANNAVAAKYGPIEEQIKAMTDNINALKQDPALTAEEKKAADAQKAAIDAKTAQIEKNKADMTTIQSWAAAAMNNALNAGKTTYEAQQIAQQLMAIANSDNPDLTKAMAIYAPYSQDPFATQKAVLDLQVQRGEISKNEAETRAANALAAQRNAGISDTGGLSADAQGWANLVANGAATIQQVPAAYKNAVQRVLNAGSNIVDSSTDNAVKAIIAANPNEWGKAADAIDKQFGAGTATKYDSWLKAVYQNGQKPESLSGNNIYTPLSASRYTMAANRIANNFIDLPIYQSAAQGQVYLKRIAAAASNPGSIGDAELLDSIVKLNTSGNAITQEQVQLITGYRSISDSLSVLQNKINNGGALSDSQRKDLVDIAQKTFNEYKQAYQPVYDQVTKQFKEAGIPEAFWTIPDLNALSEAGNKQQTVNVLGQTYNVGQVYNDGVSNWTVDANGKWTKQ